MRALKLGFLTTLQPKVIIYRGFPTVRLPTVFALKSFSWLLKVWNVTSFTAWQGRQCSFLNLILYFSGSTDYTLKTQFHGITHILCVQVWISWWVKFMPWHCFCKTLRSNVNCCRQVPQHGKLNKKCDTTLHKNFLGQSVISTLTDPGFWEVYFYSNSDIADHLRRFYHIYSP